jgi:hypothetical protein
MWTPADMTQGLVSTNGSKASSAPILAIGRSNLVENGGSIVLALAYQLIGPEISDPPVNVVTLG